MIRDSLMSAYEEAKGRAICGAIRLGLAFGGICVLFPLGCWLMLEWSGLPQWGGAGLCALAGILVDGLRCEYPRVRRLTREAERLRWQGEEEW